jgi:hypothetical protein
MAAEPSSYHLLSWKVKPVNAKENKLYKILIRKKEFQLRGMDLSETRQKQIQLACSDRNMDVYQAYSLRRQILLWGLNQSFGKVGQYKYALSFEDFIIQYLNDRYNLKNNIITEDQIRDLEIEKWNLAHSQKDSFMNQWKLIKNDFVGSCFKCLREITLKYKPKDIVICEICKLNQSQVTLKLDSGEVFTRSVKFNLMPDIILIKSIIINGKEVNWIDCKAFYASYLIATDGIYKKAPLNRVPQQIQRYNSAYGPGALIFLRGFHKKLADNWEIRFNCLFLDASDLDTSEFNQESRHV